MFSASRSRPKSSSVALHDVRDLADLRPRDAGHRIEIDAQLVGMIEIVGANRMRVQLEAREIRHPRQRRRVARHDFFGGAARRKPQRDHLDPGRPRLAARASGRRTPRRCRSDSGRARSADRRRAKRAVRDGQVVADEIELGVAGLGKEHLAGVRNGDLASAHLDDFLLILLATSTC